MLMSYKLFKSSLEVTNQAFFVGNLTLVSFFTFTDELEVLIFGL